jgi:hypothetical protein
LEDIERLVTVVEAASVLIDRFPPSPEEKLPSPWSNLEDALAYWLESEQVIK